MIPKCLVCKQEFRVPPADADRDVLLECPDCGFVGLWKDQVFSIPTWQEEEQLDRVTGKSGDDDRTAVESDETIVDDLTTALPLPYRRRLFVKILGEDEHVYEFQSGRAIIGRYDSEIVVDDPKISRKHAVIEALSRENIFVRDLASTNGTRLNGTPVRSKKLCSGDLIRVGDTELQFIWQDDE